jgi:vancomycin permeability regulator SanA
LRGLSGKFAAMIRGFFRLVFQLLMLAILAVIGTGVWLVYDGLSDKGEHADCAVVLGHAVKADGQPGVILRQRLDRAVELFRDGKVPLVIVSGASHLNSHDEATSMARYLEEHQVPAPNIIEDHGGFNTDGTAHGVAEIMRKLHLTSVMIVSHYYHITRTKLALRHEGITDIEQAHVGAVRQEDAFNVAREVVGIYYYLFKYYLKPAADKASVQAAAATEQIKAKVQSAADAAKEQAKKSTDPDQH